MNGADTFYKKVHWQESVCDNKKNNHSCYKAECRYFLGKKKSMNESSSRPFVFINAAMSADGKIATIERKQTRISGSLDFDRMDELRSTSDGIMVGIGTVLSDNPSLTVKSAARRELRRAQGLDENPARIVVDSMARTPLVADIFKKGDGKKIIAVSGSAPKEKVKELSKAADIIVAGEKAVDLDKLLKELKSRGVNRLMVEGGATLNWGLISAGLVDEIYTFIGNIIIGGRTAPTLVDGEGCLGEFCRLELLLCEKMEEGVLIRWKIGKPIKSIKELKGSIHAGTNLSKINAEEFFDKKHNL